MLTFYPTISAGELGKYAQIPSALLPVSSWAGAALRRQEKRGLPTDMVIGRIPVPTIPVCMTHVAADCGGFVATKKWGKYRYSPEQYVQWLDAIHPEWAARMDYCCENEITSGKPGIVRERQQLTTGMAYRLWDDYRDKPWVWVPTIQGWNVSDYIRHVGDMLPLIREMQEFYEARGQGHIFRVGIGTLCARASAEMIREVVMHVAKLMPGARLHLWGVKLGVFKSPIALPEQVVSADSAAWNGMFKTGRNAWKLSGYSQREWCFKVALPDNQAKLLAALSEPKRKPQLQPTQFSWLEEMQTAVS